MLAFPLDSSENLKAACVVMQQSKAIQQAEAKLSNLEL